MITFQVEKLRDRLEEIKTLLPLHWEELALNKDKVPLDPQYDIYLNREDHGELLFLTARSSGELVGYFLGFVSPGLHYKTCLTCVTDIFYIHKNHRGGLIGAKMFKAVEKELRRRGVDRWFAGSKVKADASALFEFLKFEKVEIFYSKWLGE